MPRRPTPTVPLRRLASELVRLRKGFRSEDHPNGLTREEVTARTGINTATLYRLETARARPQRRTLIALLDLYGVADPLREDLLTLPKESASPGWLHAYRADLSEVYTTYINFEAEARSVWNYEPLLIPGLLQTEAYAEAVIRAGALDATDATVRSLLEARMERQERLTKDKPLQFWAVVDEAALHRVIGGPDVMREQLRGVAEVTKRRNVTFQVVPFAAGAHPAMTSSFTVMDFPDANVPDVVYVDSMAGDLFIPQEEDVRRYANIYEHLRAVALSPAESMRLVGRLAEAL